MRRSVIRDTVCPIAIPSKKEQGVQGVSSQIRRIVSTALGFDEDFKIRIAENSKS